MSVYHLPHSWSCLLWLLDALALWWVDLDEVLQFGGISGDWAAVVTFHVCVNAAVTEHEARGGQHGGIGVGLPAQRTVPAFWAQPALILLQVERGWRSRQGGESFHCAEVLRRVPPLQELQEENTHREGRGDRHSHAPRCLWHHPPHSLHHAVNTETMHCGCLAMGFFLWHSSFKNCKKISLSVCLCGLKSIHQMS